MTYAGLTISDKPALLEAKARGVVWIVRDKTGVAWGCDIRPIKTGSEKPYWDQRNGICIVFGYDSFKFVNSDDAEPVYIPAALAQIAEMESAEKTKGCNFCCYTEYPDATLYPRDRSEFYAGRSRQVRVDDFDEDELNEVSYCPNCGRSLASPYTEGETK